jgi:endoglycosylceramidase
MRSRTLHALAVACCAAFCAAGGGAAASAAPTQPLSHAGRWITDAGGRVVIVHGINMVYKLPPYYPAKTGFGDDDAAFLARIGFNAVRVGIIWKALEPSPGHYNNAYVRRIAGTVRALARHGILSLLDFHQDLFNEKFQGEGAPDWAVQDGGLPNVPKSGFPTNYLLNHALQHAFDQFWANAPGPGGVGLADRFAAAWAHVAAAFRRTGSVFGYELFNEPWPGTLWQPCALFPGCPAFDVQLKSFYERVFARVRTVDRRQLIWYEPNVLFNGGPNTNLGPIGDPRAGFAFHDYCLTEPESGPSATCTADDNKVFSHAVRRVAKTHDAVMETEFGATNDIPYLNEMVARADRFMVPWLEWQYCGCSDPTTSGPGNKQAIVIDPSKRPSGSNLVLPTLRALVEPYPQLIAGTPTAWSFTRASRTFRLRFSTLRAGKRSRFPAGAISEIATPALVYGGRYTVTVSGAAPVSKSGAATLRIALCRGAKAVTMTVAPGSGMRFSCPGVRRRRAARTLPRPA